MAASGTLGRVVFLIGADDDVALDPKLAHQRQKQRGGGPPPPASRWAGKQADLAITAAVTERFPSLECRTARTPDELLSSGADVVVIISYLTQPSYAWYASLFDALQTLEARGVDVYPRAEFKRLISCKSEYLEALHRAALPTCPTRVLRHAELVDEVGAVQESLVEAALQRSLRDLGLLVPRAAPLSPCGDNGSSAGAAALAPAMAPFRLVSKPSNADGGYGVAFWMGGGSETAADGGSSTLPLLSSLRLGAILTCGCDLPSLRPPPLPPRRASRGASRRSSKADDPPAAASPSAATDAPAPVERPPFLRYLDSVGLSDGRPHVLLQPLVPLLSRHFELKLYFLKREPFFAALVYGKEAVVARVARPATDPALFAYLAPLLAESRRALETLPSDGRFDPKILMRVDWCVGAPELPVQPSAEELARQVQQAPVGAEVLEAVAAVGVAVAGGADGGVMRSGRPADPAPPSPRSLKRSLCWRATDAASPERRLRESQETHGTAPLSGEGAHFINEVEIQPGFYVDWDDDPDRTIEPLADAYGEYLVQVLQERRKEREGA